MPGDSTFLWILNSSEQEILDKSEMFLINLSQGIKDLMGQQNRFESVLVSIDHKFDWTFSADIFELENGLIPLPDGLIDILENLVILLIHCLFVFNKRIYKSTLILGLSEIKNDNFSQNIEINGHWLTLVLQCYKI
jgi:hypothetical protein